MAHTAFTAEVENIARSGWSPEELAGFALTWPQRGNSRTAYAWQVISTDQEGARAYYAELADDPEFLRMEAAAALAAAGWTASAINRCKS